MNGMPELERARERLAAAKQRKFGKALVDGDVDEWAKDAWTLDGEGAGDGDGVKGEDWVVAAASGVEDGGDGAPAGVVDDAAVAGAHQVDVAIGGGDAAYGEDISGMPGVLAVEDGGARSYRGCVLSFDIETTGTPALCDSSSVLSLQVLEAPCTLS